MTGGVAGTLAGRLWPLLKLIVPAILLYYILTRKARHMATFTLDQLKSDVEKNYATLTIEVGKDDKIELRNILRIDKAPRAEIMAQLDKLDKVQKNEDIGQGEQLEETTKIARDIVSRAAGKRGEDLLAVIGDDDALLMEILSKWTEATQAGEAENSSD